MNAAYDPAVKSTKIGNGFFAPSKFKEASIT
jgi:hypothetical protein